MMEVLFSPYFAPSRYRKARKRTPSGTEMKCHLPPTLPSLISCSKRGNIYAYISPRGMKELYWQSTLDLVEDGSIAMELKERYKGSLQTAEDEDV